MKTWQDIITYDTFRFFDHTKTERIFEQPNDAITSFAIDDALSLSVSERVSHPVVRVWSHPDTIVLGIPDSRLPYLEKGVRFLHEQNYEVMVRNSGGLAVALDRGVLNISLILPNVKKLSIDDGFQAMYHFIQHMFQDITDGIKAYEIVGSYCPGDYDLSIDGIKFAGISQRRVKDAAAIQIYLDIEGNSYERAKLVRKFYDLSLQGEETKFVYPTVEPEVLGSLSALLNTKITIENVIKRVREAISTTGTHIIEGIFTENEREHFSKRYAQMEKRNEIIKKIKK